MSKIPVLSIILLIMFSSPGLGQNLSTVVLDPGHGGYEFGLRAGTQREKDISLSITKQLKSFLKEEGKRVVLTREVDRYLSLDERSEFIDSQLPDVFLSVHLSDSENAVIYVTRYAQAESGLSLNQYYLLESRQRRYLYESRVLANVLGKALGTEFGFNVRQRELPLPILSTTRAPAVLIEMPAKGVTYDEKTKERIAYALGVGLQIYGQR